METESVSLGTILVQLLLLLILIGLNGFFVTVEFSAVVANKRIIEEEAEKGSRSAKIVREWLKDPRSTDKLIAGAQLGVTIASLALGKLGEDAFASILEALLGGLPSDPTLEAIRDGAPLMLSLLIVSAMHVVLGEQVPKVASLRAAEKIAMAAAWPMHIFMTLFRWFVDLLDHVANSVLKLLGLEPTGGHSLIYSVDEIRRILRESEEGGVLGSQERELLDAVFDFRELLTRQVMVPRTEMAMIEASAPLAELIQMAVDLPHNKFPVYEGDPDEIVGIVHVKDIVRVLVSGKADGMTARDLVREALFVPETLPVEKLLAQFRELKQHVAIVVDEYGGTAGMVTLEDVLEVLVGEVRDPFEEEAPEFQEMSDGTYSLSGLMLIAEVNELFGLDLDHSDYDTIGGYVMGRLDRIPREGDEIDVGRAILRVSKMDGLRVDRLTFIPKENWQGGEISPGEGDRP